MNTTDLILDETDLETCDFCGHETHLDNLTDGLCPACHEAHEIVEAVQEELDGAESDLESAESDIDDLMAQLAEARKTAALAKGRVARKTAALAKAEAARDQRAD